MGLLNVLTSVGILESDEPTEAKTVSKPASTPAFSQPSTSIAPGSSPLGVDDNVLAMLMTEVNSSAPPAYANFQQMLTRMMAIPNMMPPAAYQAAAAASRKPTSTPQSISY